MSLFYKNTSLVSKRLKTRITKESCSGSHATAPNNSSHKVFFSFKPGQGFSTIFSNTMLYFSISQKIQKIAQMMMRLVTWLRSFYFSFEFTVCYIGSKELCHRKYCKNCFLPSLKIFILKNTKAHFSQQERII